jgi:hypothetical protein
MLPRSSGGEFVSPGDAEELPRRGNLTMTMLISRKTRCPQHQQACGRGAHREFPKGLIDTRLTQWTVSIKKALHNSLHCNTLGRASFIERRGQDSLKACLLLFAVCSNAIQCHDFRRCTCSPHSMRLLCVCNRRRYKNNTNKKNRNWIPGSLTNVFLHSVGNCSVAGRLVS